MKPMTNNGWIVEIDNHMVHVLPVDDTREHAFVGCWCDPFNPECDETILVHNSHDNREAHEHGKLPN